MNAEQRERAEKATQAIYLVTDAIVADDIAALLRAGIAASERLEDFEADFRATMSEKCAPDEKHCSCVPHLRKEILSLHAEIRTFDKTLTAAQADSARLAAHVCTDNSETLKNALAEIARLEEALEERECDMHSRIRAGYDKAVADSWRAANETAWLAAWDAEWRVQETARAHQDLLADWDADNARLCALLERAAGALRTVVRIQQEESYCTRAEIATIAAAKSALAEIEGEIK